MNRPKMFFKTVTAPADGVAPKAFSAKKVIGAFFVTICVIIVAAYLAFSTFTFGTKVRNAWSEIIFAFHQPQLVAPVRVQYEQEANIDKQALNRKIQEQQAEIESLRKEIPTPTPTITPVRNTFR